LADLRAVVAGATIGFAGPRVVELVLGEALPPGSHTAESAYAAALVDAVVEPGDGERAWVESALGLRAEPVPPRPPSPAEDGVDPAATADPGSPFAHVLAARDPHRATPYDLLAGLATAWTPLHPEPGCDAGLATVSGHRVVAVALSGSPGPAAYRLAQRAIALAGRLGRPVLTLVDTPGADPSAPAEADGIAREIARTFAAMADLPTASVSVCTGEGGSGGALAVSGADQLLLLDRAYFSVISPEGAAAILDRDAAQASIRAGQLRLLPDDLLELGIVDHVTAEADLAAAVGAALDSARPGQRRTRFDSATARWLRP
jgi:acetyl-CoA carboxylase carboxyl transferase subunit beta